MIQPRRAAPPERVTASTRYELAGDVPATDDVPTRRNVRGQLSRLGEALTTHAVTRRQKQEGSR